MFSRRKLLQMVGLGSAAAVTSVSPSPQPAIGGWTDEPLVGYAGRLWAQQDMDSRISEMLHRIDSGQRMEIAWGDAAWGKAKIHPRDLRALSV